jgi:hypothetical protein
MNIKDQIELKKLAKKIMHDSYNQDKLYTAGNYWKFYEKNILKQIEKNDLSKFRSWVGGKLSEISNLLVVVMKTL